MDVSAWLHGLGLEQYAPAFRDNEVDGDVLPDLTAEDLIGLGVTLIGHRRKLLSAIAALGAAVPAPVVTATSAPVLAPVPALVQPDAERRQLTVMFVDLVGSTALSTRFDPEDLRELIGGYHNAVAETVGHFDGFVAKYMGDGILIYFGYPQAHEDDAERAVRAGLAVIEAVGKLAAREELRVRLGIATGVAVVGYLIGEGAAQERGVVGETPNLAARLQGLAAPSTLVIADATRRQIGELFDLEDLGPRQLAGFADPQRAWRVLSDSEAVSRFEALRSGETPLVGREEEVELLVHRWQQAKSGEGRVVLISGEPGIGKSRLTAALSEHIESEPHIRLRYFCSPHHQDSAFYPLIGQLERAAGFVREDGPETKLDRLATLLAPAAEAGDISLLAELLSLSGADRFAPLDLNPQLKKERTFVALLRQLEGLARQQPVLMIFEDLHWIDPTSREFLDLVLGRIDHLPVLLVATFRPEFRPPWTGQPYVTVMSLNRLGRGEGAAMVQRLAGNAALLPPDVIAEIVERTDGVPLFVEEMTKAVLEAGAERGREIVASLPSTGLGVPATLQASLMARLDRLGAAAKGVAQIGAAIGREFSYELAVSVVELAEERFQEALQRLVDAELLYQRGQPPRSRYIFKHALIQDVAYQSLLRRTRQRYHRQVAELLENSFADMVEASPELMAHHYSEAGLPDQAVTYRQRAGERAVRRSANQEATGHLTAGLAQLAQLPETPERAKRELALQRLLGQASFAVRGGASPEATRAFSRARELCAAIGDDSSVIPVLFGLWFSDVVGADYANAERSANQLLERAERTGSIGALVVGNMTAAATPMFLGALMQARRHFEKSIEYYRSLSNQQATHLAYEYGVDFGEVSYVHAAWCFWLLGHSDQALWLANEALATSERLQHHYTRSRGLYWNGVLHAFRREWSIVELRAAAAITSAQERGQAMAAAAGRIVRGSARVMLEPRDDAVAEIREGLAAYHATGARYHGTLHLILLAQALAACGRDGEGLSALREAAALVEETGERYFEAEIHRLKGNMLLAENSSADAEACYRKALAVARAQEARSLELRAAGDLARLWAEQGRRAEARDLLAAVHGWFTEGFDTADLEEAKALLVELT
jgi:predicted ATPase/class 3 adenylate cyclase